VQPTRCIRIRAFVKRRSTEPSTEPRRFGVALPRGWPVLTARANVTFAFWRKLKSHALENSLASSVRVLIANPCRTAPRRSIETQGVLPVYSEPACHLKWHTKATARAWTTGQVIIRKYGQCEELLFDILLRAGGSQSRAYNRTWNARVFSKVARNGNRFVRRSERRNVTMWRVKSAVAFRGTRYVVYV